MANMKFYCDAERCIECNACVTACKNENEVPWGVNRRRVVTIKDGQDVWIESTEGARIKVKSLVTRRVAAGVAFTPFHFGGHFQGNDLRSKYPAGADPFVLGEACNTAFTYGYDSVTQMQETKCTLCRIIKA